MVVALPAFAVGNGFTTTTTLLEFLQFDDEVSVTVYVVVVVGFTLGFARVELNPDGLELQL